MIAEILSIVPNEPDTGSLKPVVVAAGWVVSAAVALGTTWRGRAKWEPNQDDIDKGPSKVGGLLCAVALGLMWVFLGSSDHLNALAKIAITAAIVCLIGLLTYMFLISLRTYNLVRSTGPNDSKPIKIIGGLVLKDKAKAKLEQRDDLDVQSLFAGAAYKFDLVWKPWSRALAKVLFILAYLALTVGGTIALSAVAIIIAVKQR